MKSIQTIVTKPDKSWSALVDNPIKKCLNYWSNDVFVLSGAHRISKLLSCLSTDLRIEHGY